MKSTLTKNLSLNGTVGRDAPQIVETPILATEPPELTCEKARLTMLSRQVVLWRSQRYNGA
jgi:hypothetical protein